MIDRAGPADVEAVTALWNEVIAQTTITFTSAPKDTATIAALIENQPVFVARDGTEVLGFATFAQFRGGDGYAHTMEHAIYLTQAARGRGLGRALFLAVEEAAKAGGAHSMIAGISGENACGIAFHAAMGFVQVGLVPDAGRKFGRFLDLVLMQKRL